MKVGVSAPRRFKPPPMPQNTAKLVLPTVATCRWRTVGDRASAECGLVTSLIGAASSPLSTVVEETCRACCNSFPPSPTKLNPVVASLVYLAASQILDAGGTLDCTPDQAAQLKKRAEHSLELIFPDQFSLTPARKPPPVVGWAMSFSPAVSNSMAKTIRCVPVRRQIFRSPFTFAVTRRMI